MVELDCVEKRHR